MTRPRTHRTGCLALTLLLACLLSACGNKEDLGPSLYTIENESAPSINAALDGKGGFLDSTEVQDNKDAATDAEGSDAATDGEEGGVEVPTQMQIYRYRDLPEKGATVEAYMNVLIDPEQSFLIVNSSGQQTGKPDFSAEEGSVILYRANLERRTNFCIRLEWKSSELTVSVYIASNTVGLPSASGSGRYVPETDTPALTAESAVNFLKGLSPQTLNLPGESMAEYNVYYTEGKALVNGITCLRLRLYDTKITEGSNAFLATYFLAADKSHLFRLDATSGEVIELPLPAE